MKVPPNPHECCSRTNPQKISCQNDARLYDKGTNVTGTSAAISERRARMDGYTIVRAILQSKLETEIRDLAELEQAIQEELAKEPSMIAPWHNSVVLQSACREGMRLAA